MKILKNILNYALVGGLFLVPFIPFIVSTTMFFPFITGKGFAFRILIDILFGLYVYMAIAYPEYRPRMSWITKSIGFFAIAILIADLLSVNVSKSLWSNYERMEGFVLIAHLVMYYFVASGVFDLKKWNAFWNTNILASVAMSFYGIAQLAGWATINQGGVRLDATFGNAAYMAIYLVLNIFLCLYMLVQANKPAWQKWIYSLIIVLEAVILYFTATRGAILGLIGGVVLAALLIVWKQKTDSANTGMNTVTSGVENKNIDGRRLKKFAYGFLIGVLVLVGGFYLIRNTDFVKKSPVLSRFVFTSSEVKSQGRYYVWPMAIQGIKENPVFGWGQESFNYVFNKYYDPRMYNQEQWFDRTHDIVLDWMIAGGLVGFLAYVSMFAALLYYLWRRKSQMTVAEKAVITGMLAAYTFHNIFVFDNLISYIIFFSVLAFVHSVNIRREEVQEQAIATSYRTKALSGDVNNYLVLPVVFVVTILAVYYINVPAIQASRTLIQAITPQQNAGPEKNLELFKKVFAYNSFGSSEALEQLVQVSTQIASTQQIPDTIKQQFFDYTKEKLEEKVKETPHDARYLVFAGSFFNRFGQYDLAIDYLTKAVAESPKKQPIYFELGSAYIAKGDVNKAKEIFKTAYDLEPDSQESKIIYALGAIYARDNALSTNLLYAVGTSTIVNDNRFLQTYARIGDYASVIAILSARLEQDPTNMQYLLSLASTYATIGQKQRAVQIIQYMEQLDPSFKAQGDEYIKQINKS
jgi:O-antigen ligase/tetratricopeptide (TPR) repeat protein